MCHSINVLNLVTSLYASFKPEQRCNHRWWPGWSDGCRDSEQTGVYVDLYDAMPSVGRKFLLAGKGGLNITHSEPREPFLSRYGARRDRIEPLLERFGPESLCSWIHGLGVETFVGSSGRVFPKAMKAAPMLRALLHRLRETGVHFHIRHRWCGWRDDALLFQTPEGEKLIQADAVILCGLLELQAIKAFPGVNLKKIKEVKNGYDC